MGKNGHVKFLSRSKICQLPCEYWLNLTFHDTSNILKDVAKSKPVLPSESFEQATKSWLLGDFAGWFRCLKDSSNLTALEKNCGVISKMELSRIAGLTDK